jgi:hypothetical protein
MHEPLPQLRSQLLPADTAAATTCAGRVGGGGQEPTQAGALHFERLLLEAIASGSASCHEDIERVLHCTLARHQVGIVRAPQLLHSAVHQQGIRTCCKLVFSNRGM